jgi:hypothetical protein
MCATLEQSPCWKFFIFAIYLKILLTPLKPPPPSTKTAVFSHALKKISCLCTLLENMSVLGRFNVRIKQQYKKTKITKKSRISWYISNDTLTYFLRVRTHCYLTTSGQRKRTRGWGTGNSVQHIQYYSMVVLPPPHNLAVQYLSVQYVFTYRTVLYIEYFYFQKKNILILFENRNDLKTFLQKIPRPKLYQGNHIYIWKIYRWVRSLSEVRLSKKTNFALNSLYCYPMK